ncbi:MAG: hypothetical protein HKN36_05120 [Hellea sp.]|nr:hypothetical protein [Hellea sp.]
MTDRFPQTVGAGETDIGLRNFLVGTYRWMGLAMAFAGVVSYFLSGYLIENVTILMQLAGNPLLFLGVIIVLMLAFGLVGRNINRMSQSSLVLFLFAMAGGLGALLSISFAVIGLRLGEAALFELATKVFFMTVAMFGAMSLFGYTAKMDLTGVAKFAGAVFFGIIALYLASMFGLFEMGTGLHLGLSVAGLIVVGLLVAWETQALKSMYYGTRGDTALMNKVSIFGAASLLLAFYNMFQFLLNIMSIFSD